MRNLIIRIISFILCVGLLAAGVALTFVETMKNDELMADFEEVKHAAWIPEANEPADEPVDEPTDEPVDEPTNEPTDENE